MFMSEPYNISNTIRACLCGYEMNHPVCVIGFVILYRILRIVYCSWSVLSSR